MESNRPLKKRKQNNSKILKSVETLVDTAANSLLKFGIYQENDERIPIELHEKIHEVAARNARNKYLKKLSDFMHGIHFTELDDLLSKEMDVDLQVLLNDVNKASKLIANEDVDENSEDGDENSEDGDENSEDGDENSEDEDENSVALRLRACLSSEAAIKLAGLGKIIFEDIIYLYSLTHNHFNALQGIFNNNEAVALLEKGHINIRDIQWFVKLIRPDRVYHVANFFEQLENKKNILMLIKEGILPFNVLLSIYKLSGIGEVNQFCNYINKYGYVNILRYKDTFNFGNFLKEYERWSTEASATSLLEEELEKEKSKVRNYRNN